MSHACEDCGDETFYLADDQCGRCGMELCEDCMAQHPAYCDTRDDEDSWPPAIVDVPVTGGVL